MSYKSLYFPTLKRRLNYGVYSHYKDYRQEIRVDCQGRCIYCDAHENELGGSECMTLDHFRPKDKYTHLQCEPTNLVWSCLKCNGFKNNTWPAFGTSYTVISTKGFIDPFRENLKDYFDILPDGRFIPLKHPAKFMISELKLNRTGAKKLREKRNIKYKSRQEADAFFTKAIKEVDAILKNHSLPIEARNQLLQHKNKLEQQHDLVKKDSEPDFNLY